MKVSNLENHTAEGTEDNFFTGACHRVAGKWRRKELDKSQVGHNFRKHFSGPCLCFCLTLHRCTVVT